MSATMGKRTPQMKAEHGTKHILCLGKSFSFILYTARIFQLKCSLPRTSKNEKIVAFLDFFFSTYSRGEEKCHNMHEKILQAEKDFALPVGTKHFSK